MPEDKVRLHEQIFLLAYHSQGAFTQDIVYKLPVYLRIFYTNQLIKSKEKEAEQMERSSKSSPNSSMKGPSIRK
jgi:hypothetical protein